MKEANFIKSLLDEYQSTSLSPAEALNELSILLVYHLTSVNVEQMAGIQEISDGKTTLKESLAMLGGYCAANGQVRLEDLVSRSRSSDVLSAEQVRRILKNLSALTFLDRFKLAESLLEMISTPGRARAETAVSGSFVELISDLGGTDGQVYFPYSGSLGLALYHAKQGKSAVFEAADINPIAWAVCLLANIEIQTTDPLFSDLSVGASNEIDEVRMIAPLGLRIDKKDLVKHEKLSGMNISGELLAVRKALDITNGHVVALVSNGLLFRSGNEHDVRDDFVMRGILEAVIQLPEGIIPNTLMAPALLILDKKRPSERPVYFYNAAHEDLVGEYKRGKALSSEFFSRVGSEVNARKDSAYATYVAIDTIKANDFDLTVNRYVLGEASEKLKSIFDSEENSEHLEGLATLIRAQPLKDENSPDATLFFAAGAADIQENGYLAEPGRRLYLSGKAAGRARLQRLQPGDVLLGIKGTVGVVGLVDDNCQDNWVANQNFQVIRLPKSSSIDPRYLLTFLRSPLMQAYMQEQITGTTIPMLKTADIKNMPIAKVSDDEQQKVIEAFEQIQQKFQQITEIRHQIQDLENAFWPLTEGK